MLGTFTRWIATRLRGTTPATGEDACLSPEDSDVRKTFRCQGYAGSRDRDYLVHVPSGYDPAGPPRPLVVVLHGCDEDHEAIRHDTGFNGIADREGFLVAYPFITRYDGWRGKNCWGFWKPKHIHKGGGEVQDIAGIIHEIRRNHRVDPDRIHIAGVSSGAAMAVAALVAHPQLFASGCSTAGVPYGETSKSVSGVFKPVEEVAEAMNAEMGDGKRPVPILVIHSTGDRVVNIRASGNIRDSWGQAFGVDTSSPVRSVSGVTKGTLWTHARYGDLDGGTLVETLVLEGLPHGWYGARDGKYAFSNAPDTSQLAWEFFKSHPRRFPLTKGESPPSWGGGAD